VLANYGESLRMYGQPEEGLDQLRNSSEIYHRAKRDTDKYFAQHIDWQAACELELGHYPEPQQLLDQSPRIYQKTGGLTGNRHLLPRAALLIATGRVKEAQEVLESAAGQSGNQTPDTSARLEFAVFLADTELAAGDSDKAIRVTAEALKVIEHN